MVDDGINGDDPSSRIKTLDVIAGLMMKLGPEYASIAKDMKQGVKPRDRNISVLKALVRLVTYSLTYLLFIIHYI